MRFMVIVKATPDSERAGFFPDPEMMAQMGQFNQELIKAGILLARDGLQPSSMGVRVKFSGDARTVAHGPFAETRELVAGFWIWQVKSMEEAIEWVKRCPNPHKGESAIEIRQIFELEDLAPSLSENEIKYKVETRSQLPNQALEG